MAAALFCLCLNSCKKDETSTFIPCLTISGPTNFSFASAGADATLRLRFRCNTKWELIIPADASWITADPMSGDAGKDEFVTFTVKLSAAPLEGPSRSATLKLQYSDKSKDITVSQSNLPQSSQFEIPDDMLFSTTLGRNTTNVCQGFDYDPDEDIIYITQKYGTYQNHIGWQKRETKNGTTVAPNYMTLRCFSHGNNIAIEKTASGAKFVWAPNYADRQDDGSYDKPKIISRFPLATGKTIYNTETTENYYFGMNVTWPAFDFKNDMVAVTDYKTFYVYKLSEIMALPEETITLDFKITYGGHKPETPVETNKDEWSGYPVVKARDCRKAKVLYKVPFDYGKRGLHWQSYCIDNGWIYAILQGDGGSAPNIIHDSYVEAYKMDGSKNIYKIRQEYMQNRDRILEFDWNERDYFYCEPEGIKVFDGQMLLLYCMKGNTDAHKTRRPVIFRLAAPTAE